MIQRWVLLVVLAMVLASSGSGFGVDPLLTAKWGPGCLYNASCPPDTAAHATCLHVPLGSGAVAMAQLMHFYNYPATGQNEYGYLHPVYGIQYANFGATTYTWPQMPDSLTSANQAVATLLYHCGVAQKMNWGTHASSSEPTAIDSAMKNFFRYPQAATWKWKDNYPAAEWQLLVKAELDSLHPVLCCGKDTSGTIHFFICDGYLNTGQFHFNFGNNATNNGYYSFDNLNPGGNLISVSQGALFGLAPPLPGPQTVTMDFEQIEDFSLVFGNWTAVDGDLHDTYGIEGHSFAHQTEPMAWLCFNPASVTPAMSGDPAIQPHGGAKFGACFSSNPPSNNDWFISPRVRLGTNGSFSFWVKSYTDFYGLDEYIVAVSTTDSLPGSFTPISGASPLQTTTGWEKKTFNLSAYNGQQVYIAIRCVSNDRFLMMIDDLEIRTEASSVLDADFIADRTTIRVGDTVNFSDQSAGLPTSWSWSFPGAIPVSSAAQNPQSIRYNQTGTFSVSLKVSNGTSSDSITRTMYIKVTGYPSEMSLDFESVSDFSLTFDNWSVADVGGGSTYGITGVTFPHSMDPMAWICFNPGHTTPPLTNMIAHSGQKLGCSFSSMPPKNPNNKWLISPKLSLGFNPQIEFWVQTYNPLYGDEKFNVAVSTTDSSPSSFTAINLVPEIAPIVWTKKIYQLTNYSGQDVYIGIQCVTNDVFIFMIDDIAITSTVGMEDQGPLPSLGIFPNPATDRITLLADASIESAQVSIFSSAGLAMGSTNIQMPGGRGQLDVHHLAPGIYILRISTGNHELIRKLTIID